MKTEIFLFVPDESIVQRVTRVAAYKGGIDSELRATGFCWEAPQVRKGASPQHWHVHKPECSSAAGRDLYG